MSMLSIEVYVPSLHCDWCGAILYPDGFSDKGLEVISLHRVPLDQRTQYHNPLTFRLIGFTDADLDSQAKEAGWKFLEIYGRRLNACLKCQKKGEGLADRSL